MPQGRIVMLKVLQKYFFNLKFDIFVLCKASIPPLSFYLNKSLLTRTKKLHGIFVNQGGVRMELNQNLQNQGEIDMDSDF